MIVILASTPRSGGGHVLQKWTGLEWLGFVSPSRCHQSRTWSLCGSERVPHDSLNHGVSMPIVCLSNTTTSVLPLLLPICQASSLECVFGCPVLKWFFYYYFSTLWKAQTPFFETASERTHMPERESRALTSSGFRSGAVCVARLTQ